MKLISFHKQSKILQNFNEVSYYILRSCILLTLACVYVEGHAWAIRSTNPFGAKTTILIITRSKGAYRPITR